MSSEQAQAKDNATVYGYGRPTVLTGAAPAGVAIAQNAGPGKSQCQHPGSGKSQREHRLGPRPGCRRVAFGAKVGVVYTAADIEELSARLIATTDPAAAHQLHELDSALAQLPEQ